MRRRNLAAHRPRPPRHETYAPNYRANKTVAEVKPPAASPCRGSARLRWCAHAARRGRQIFRRHFGLDSDQGESVPYCLSWLFVGLTKRKTSMVPTAACKHNPIYVCEMMERLGVDPGGRVEPRLSLSYLTAFRRCRSCPSKQTCRAWLDNTYAPVTFAPRFCPNADIFFELQVDYPGSWRTT